MSCRLLDRWSLDVQRDGVVEVRDVGVLLTTLLPNNGDENCAARCGEKNSDVGGSTGLKPAANPEPLSAGGPRPPTVLGGGCGALMGVGGGVETPPRDG